MPDVRRQIPDSGAAATGECSDVHLVKGRNVTLWASSNPMVPSTATMPSSKKTRALAEPEAKAEVGAAELPWAREIVPKGCPAKRKKPITRKQLKETRERADPGVPNEQSGKDFKGRFISRLQARAPEALADATVDAATSTIKHLPKAISVLACLVLTGAPAILTAGSSLIVSLVWIGYELWKRK
jgi:hypothetical protein